MFRDRTHAGEILSRELERYAHERVIVLAVPRGGVAVAYDTIRKYDFEWDLIIPRKIGAPRNKEVAIGAVSADGSYFVDEEHVRMLGVSQKYIEKEVDSQVAEIKRRLKAYRGREDFPDVKGKTAIIIDDGIATGFTILAAVNSIKNQGAAKTVLAVPVAPRETVENFKEIVDEMICLLIPDEFYAVGMHYEEFGQVPDEEVFEMIHVLNTKEARR